MLQRLRVEPFSSYLERVRKGTVYPVAISGGFVFLSGLPPDPSHFGTFNEVYARYFLRDAPARIFLHVPSFFGPFDVDCVAAV